MRKWAAILLCYGLAATACTRQQGVHESVIGRHTWTIPHVLRYADITDVTTLNPHLSTATATQWIGRLTAAWLIRWDRHNDPVPELVLQVPTKADGGVSKDGLTITYHLRKGVRWSDGAPFTADDVVFSTRVVLNPANNETGRAGWDRIRSIQEPDSYTVVFKLSKPYSPFVETFFSTAGGNPCILPKHLLAQYPTINSVAYNSKPIGIGPFVVDHWERGSRVVMKANPLYWRGRPRLDEIIYTIAPDRNTIVNELQTHEIDLWPLLGGAYEAQVQQIPGIVVHRRPSYGWNHLDFNMARPALSDLAVRLALRYAVDRNQIRQKIGHGFGLISDSPTPASAPYAATVPITPFDIAKANLTLDRAGWKRAPDGVRAKDRRRLELTLFSVAGSPDIDNVVELLRANWNKIGVSLSYKKVPAALMFAPGPQGGVLNGTNWDIAFFGWSNDAIGDYSGLYGCESFPPNGQNDPRWCDRKAESAMQALYADYDQSKRTADVASFVKQFVADAPVIVEMQREDISAYNSDLQNFTPGSLTMFDDMMHIDI